MTTPYGGFHRPIETSYKGYRFRSRLEARWAVFFDALGLRYEYESQGFCMDGAGCYLPDFLVHIPKYDDWAFVEVKPSPLVTNSDRDKIFALAMQYPVIVATGSPWYDVRESGMVYSYPVVPEKEIGLRPLASFAICPCCNKVYITNFRQDGWGYSCGEYLAPPHVMRQETEHDRLIFAYHAARAARFEYGERQGRFTS